MHVRSALLGVGIGAIVLSFPWLAAADASIAVRLTDAEGRPVDGTVTLQKSGVTRSCRTTASRCTLTAPAGSYTVTMRPVRGSAPAPRSFTVPASGTLSLALTAGPTTTTTTTTTSAVSTTQPAVRATTTTGTSTTAGTTTTAGSTSRIRRATRAPTTRATRVRPGAITTRPIGPTAVRTTPTPTTGTSASRDGTTSGGSSGTTTTPTTTTVTTTTTAAVTQHTDTASGRNLATGHALSVQGSVLDAAGRPTDATLTVRRAGSIVGTARTTAGRFSLYDLPAATYEVSLASSRGTNGTGRFTVGSTTSRVTLRVP